MECYLAIDQGTHASRALLFDEDGDTISAAVCEVQLQRMQGARVEQAADDLLTSIHHALTEVMAGIDIATQQRIRACGIATQRSSVLAWHRDGTPVSALLSWQDTRGQTVIDSMQSQHMALQQLTGLPLSAHYGASKLRWLQQWIAREGKHPLDTIQLSPWVSYVLYHLLAQRPYLVDHCNAQRTQLFDVQSLNWSHELCARFEVAEQRLPMCVPVRHAYGRLADYPINVTAVSGDQNAALCGMIAADTRVALVNLGSGAFVMRHLPAYAASHTQLTSIALSDSREVSYVREATINGAGNALDWVAQHYNISDIEQRLPQWLDTINAPAMFINSVGGLGSPWWRTDIEPYFVDAALGAVAEGQRVIGVIESILFMVHANLLLMQQEAAIALLRVSGGLSQLDGLCQRLADLTGLDVSRGNEREATARGIAWLAAGRPDGWQQRAGITLFRPRSDAALQQRYQQFNNLLQHRLALH